MLTEKFVQRHCLKCEFCIWSKSGTSHFYPYAPEEGYEPIGCGEITDEGGYHTEFDRMELCQCKKGYKK